MGDCDTGRDGKNRVRVRVWPFRFRTWMPILLSGSGYKPAFSFSGTGTGSTRKNPSSRIAGFEPGKLEAGTIKPLCMPLLTLYKSGLAVYLRCRLRHRRAQEAAAMKAVSKV
ncbi:hypothetical protein CISIN_1g033810mg [Citrus sinensis]|uniref:Uncharacterized protein n=1 Tax=Citrus sinensis TaxID=2711 RepID=A0A067DCI8_CITSI|nr:hypothetical protein CISIN_1g033810mg [Citrus sinensis]